jgi:hypothetical protein
MSVSKSFLTASLPLAVLLQAGSAVAAVPMQKEAGWGGSEVFLGGGYIELRNNEVAGNKIVTLDDKTHDNLGDAKSQSAGTPIANFMVRYTLESKKTELFAGTDESDALRMDNTTAFGVRHSFGDKGIIGARALVSSSLAATQVYNDPLDTTGKRKKTDRETIGGGLKWEKVMNSNLDIDLRLRRVNVVNDRNGDTLFNDGFITSAERHKLDRDGDIANVEVEYTYVINKANILIPYVMYTNNNRDGSARDFSQGDVGMAYVFKRNKWTIASKVDLGWNSYKNKNPVFDDKQDTNFWSAASKVVYAEPYGMKNWNVSGGALMSVGNSDISFYNTRIFVAYAGVGYKF